MPSFNILGVWDFFLQVVQKVLLSDLQRCGTLSNLRILALAEWFLSDDCYPLMYLLRRSPNIERLALLLGTCGAITYDLCDKLPNATAETGPSLKESETPVNCEKLRKILIIHPQGDKRVRIIVRILSAYIVPLPEIRIEP
uniref:Uncharacterized protein n=1 Tax=Oryza barthii TaxID=65489 RepID=A0A0D3GWC7_9ORYZ